MTLPVLSTEISYHKPIGIMIRELSGRIYQLLTLSATSDGNNFHRIIIITEKKHPQYTIDRIYKYLHNLYFYPSENGNSSASGNPFVIENNNAYLQSSSHLWKILKLIGIHPNFYDIPHHIRQLANKEMLKNLVTAIPTSGILYKDRQKAGPYFMRSVETTVYDKKHPDGQPLPDFIDCVKIHQFHWYGMRSLKIWEIVPKMVSNPTPVCLIHGFLSNYYSFHLEGNESIDYHLAKNGSRIFLLDHIRKDNNANLDVYAESLVTTLIDFARVQCQTHQVILGGHSMGGILSVIKTILDSLRRPRCVIAIKALMVINSPLSMKRGFWLPGNALKYLLLPLSLFGRHGTLPFKGLARIARLIPFVDRIATYDFIPLLEKAHTTLGIKNENWTKQFSRAHETINPITTDPKVLRAGMKLAIKNPPKTVLEHFANIADHESGVISYQHDWASGLVDYDFEPEDRKDLEFKEKYSQINYSENFYRIPPTIPLLEIHNTHDPLAYPDQFDEVWALWPQMKKLRLTHTPSDELDGKRCVAKIKEFINRHGLSTVIGLQVTEGRHLDALISEKETIKAFISAVESLSVSALKIIKTTIEAHVQFREHAIKVEQRFISERDFSKKIRFIDPEVFKNKAHRQQLIQLFLQLVSTYEPQARAGESFHNFMVRDTKEIENENEIKYNLLHTCVHKIMEFDPDINLLMEAIFEIVTTKVPPPVPECYRSLIDLSLLLFDVSIKGPLKEQKRFLKTFENFLAYCDQHDDRTVDHLSFRAYLHTRTPYYIKKGGAILVKMKPEWLERAQQVFHEEIEHQISELKYEPTQNFLVKTKPLMDVYQQQEQKFLHLFK
ncbi:hypothetical protein WDW89_07830 [Deltaproteobacteria bacterium TL4]